MESMGSWSQSSYFDIHSCWTFVILSEGNDAFDTGGALEDGDGFLDGGNDSKGFRSGGGENQGLTSNGGFKGDAMEGRLKRDSVRV